MTEIEAAEKLKAYIKCQKRSNKGIHEDCNSKKCDDCYLCYEQGNSGEHIQSVEKAVQALEKQIPKKPVKSGNQVFRGMLIHIIARFAI